MAFQINKSRHLARTSKPTHIYIQIKCISGTTHPLFQSGETFVFCAHLNCQTYFKYSSWLEGTFRTWESRSHPRLHAFVAGHRPTPTCFHDPPTHLQFVTYNYHLSVILCESDYRSFLHNKQRLSPICFLSREVTIVAIDNPEWGGWEECCAIFVCEGRFTKLQSYLPYNLLCVLVFHDLGRSTLQFVVCFGFP